MCRATTRYIIGGKRINKKEFVEQSVIIELRAKLFDCQLT